MPAPNNVRESDPTTEEADMSAQARSRTADASRLLLVQDAMHHGALICPRETPLSAVARMMAEHRVHAIVVADDPDDIASLWGVVSDLDLVAAAGVRDLREQTAGASAGSAAVLVTPHQPLVRAAQLMTEHATAHLLVVDPDSGRPVGVLSTLDIARGLADGSAALDDRP
jgi:CBS domain-containing protein